MKKVLLLTLLALLCLDVNAQLQKGNIVIGGSLGLNTSSTEQDYDNYNYSSKNTSFSLSPEAGYLPSDRAIAGLSLGFSKSTGKNTQGTSEQKSHGSAMKISPFYRYYFPLGDKVALFAHSSVALEFSKNKTVNQNGTVTEENTSKGRSFSIGVGAGANYFLNEKWAIEASFGGLSYRTGKSDIDYQVGDDSNYKNSGFNLNFGIDSFSLGLKYFISPK